MCGMAAIARFLKCRGKATAEKALMVGSTRVWTNLRTVQLGEGGKHLLRFIRRCQDSGKRLPKSPFHGRAALENRQRLAWQKGH